MSSKAFVRRKAWKRAVRAKVVSGLINDANGNFVEPRMIGETTSNHMLAGYKVGQFQRRRTR